jgi:hypothetical protein
MSEIVYKVHQMADVYPKCTPDEEKALEASVRESGVKYPVLMWKDEDKQNWLLDGRTRMKVVERLKKEGVEKAENGAPIQCEIAWFTGTESAALDYIDDINLRRRSLTSSQKAAVAIRSGALHRQYRIKEEGLKPGDIEEGAEGDLAEKVALKSGTNRQYVFDCHRLYKEQPDLLDRVANGELSIPQALRVAKRRAAGLPDEPEAGEGPEEVQVSEEKPEIIDGLGNPVAPDLEKVFEARDRVREAKRHLSKALAELEAAASGPGGKYMSLQTMKTDIQNARRHADSHQPHAPCPICSATGKDPKDAKKKCGTCKGKKYLDKVLWKEVPSEIREVFEKAGAGAEE